MLGEFIGEALVEGLLGLIWRAVKATIGFVYLYLRYWWPHRVRKQLAQRYGNRYATAGTAVLTVGFQVLGVALLVLWLAVVVAMVIGIALDNWWQ